MREKKGISQRELAKLIQLSPSTVAMYELDKRSPDNDTLIKLADYFNVPTDYLLGRTDSRGNEEALNTIRQALEEYDHKNRKRSYWKRFWNIIKDEKGGVSSDSIPYIMRMLTSFLLVQNGVPPGVVTGSPLLDFQGDFELNNKNRQSLVDLLDEVVNSSKVPVLGTIQAGLPILADENIEEYLDVPEYIQADFVLRVQGDSMIGAGILDGDLAICKAVEAAQSGQIVVALRDVATDFSEATLKYYYDVNGDGPVLRPANPQHQEIPMKEGYRIAGILVALIREEAPCYQVYRNYLADNDSDEWTEVIEMASSAGIKPQHLKAHVDMLIEMGKTKE